MEYIEGRDENIIVKGYKDDEGIVHIEEIEQHFWILPIIVELAQESK